LLFVGIDWAEKHHDVGLMDESGEMLQLFRVPEGVRGMERLHAAIAERAEEPGDVVVGIETDRGLLVGALIAAGYAVRDQPHVGRPLS
jgi:hypothetical protein